VRGRHIALSMPTEVNQTGSGDRHDGADEREVERGEASTVVRDIVGGALAERAGCEVSLYHASPEVFEPGLTLREERRAILESNVWIEEEFERLRRGRSVPRCEARFAMASGADCVRYLRAQQDYENRPMYLYRVKMQSPQRHPMALVDAARRNREHQDRLREIVGEYWCPTRAWQFWEYLDRTMTILENLSLPDAAMVAGAAHRYNGDYDLAARIWPRGAPSKRVRRLV
jgi:hypothetical protein